jgi:hypothetical protein
VNLAKIRGLMRLYWSGDFTLEINIARIVYAAMHPHMHPDCCPIEQQAIQDRLDAWYEADGRHDPAHPMHALYTGLAEKFLHQEQAQ